LGRDEKGLKLRSVFSRRERRPETRYFFRQASGKQLGNELIKRFLFLSFTPTIDRSQMEEIYFVLKKQGDRLD
jgi:hypothetical protein